MSFQCPYLCIKGNYFSLAQNFSVRLISAAVERVADGAVKRFEWNTGGASTKIADFLRAFILTGYFVSDLSLPLNLYSGARVATHQQKTNKQDIEIIVQLLTII